jgi:hypothetical protein
MPSSMSSPWSVGVGVDLRTFRKADAVEQKMARLVLDGRRTYATFFTTTTTTTAGSSARSTAKEAHTVQTH